MEDAGKYIIVSHADSSWGGGGLPGSGQQYCCDHLWEEYALCCCVLTLL